MHRAWILGLVLFAVFLSAPLFASGRAAAASTTGTVQIVYPLNGAALGIEGTRVQLAVSNFVLDPSALPCVATDHGRIRLYVNDLFVRETSEANTSLPSLAASDTKIGAQLVCTDSSSFDPQVWHNITITAGEPSVVIQNPGRPLGVSTEGIRLAYTITRFALDPADYAGPRIPGAGHVHILINGSLAGTSTGTFADLTGLPIGPYTLAVELHNNDHSLVATSTHPFGYNDTIAATGVIPSVRIVSPSSAGTVSSSAFRVTVAVTGIELDVENYAGAKIPGHGHLHYYLDGSSSLAATSTSPFVDFASLSIGPHSIKAELHNNDHSLYTDAGHPQGFNATVAVTVAGTSIAILNPVNNAAVGTAGFRMEVRVQGFDISASNYGGTNVVGQGHIHYYEGTTLLGATASTTFDTGPLTAGAHTIKAELHNNDHSLFTDATHPFGFNASIAVTASNPSIAIVSPAANAAVSNTGFRITVAVAGLVIDPENYGGANIPGHGHVHFYEGANLLGTSTSTWFDVTLGTGTHTIRAELRNNDHSPLNPAVSAQVTVKVGPPELKVLEPVPASSVSSLGFRMRFAISNFTLDPQDYGGTAIAGQGHVHVYQGTTLLATTVSDHVLITGLAAGGTTLKVELRNNDHSPLASPVFVTVSVTVASPSIALTAPTTVTVGQDLRISWTVTGFVLDSAAFGGAPEPGRGHVHVFIDGTYTAAVASTSYVIQGLAAGTHNISVELYNNDHSELTTEYSSHADVSVQAAASPVTTATVDATVFYGSVGLLAVVVIVLAALLMRKGRKGPRKGDGSGEDSP